MKIRIMRTAFLFTAFFLMQRNLWGQQQLKYVLPPGEEHLIQKETGDPIFEIVDLTGDSVLGYLPTQRGDNDRIAIYPPLSKQEWLTLLASAYGVEKGVKTGHAALFVVNDITIGGNDRELFSHIKGTLYESLLGKQAYVKVKVVDEFYVNRSSGLSQAGKYVAGMMASVLSTAPGSVSSAPSRPVDRSEVIRSELARLQFISNGTFPSGIYKNFQEFKQLRPSYEQFYVKVDTLSKTVQVNGFSIGDSTMYLVSNAFAIAVGNELYLCKDDKLYPAEARGNNLYFSKYVDPGIRKNQARFWAVNVGRQVEGHYRNPFDNVYAIMIREFKGQPVNNEVTKVDPDTGQFIL